MKYKTTARLITIGFFSILLFFLYDLLTFYPKEDSFVIYAMIVVAYGFIGHLSVSIGLDKLMAKKQDSNH